MARLRHAGIIVALASVPTGTRAEHCHHEPLPKSEKHFSVRGGFETASYANALYEGRYETWLAEGRYRLDWFEVSALLPAHHLTRNGITSEGLGDPLIGAHFRLMEGERWFFGGSASVSLPVGSAREQLGMGHAMAMPSTWFGFRGTFLSVHGSVGYGRSLDVSGGGHRHGAPMPIVNPMNMEELTASVVPRLHLDERFRAFVRLNGAVPLDADGVGRAIGGIGGEFETESFGASLEVQAGLAGDPFTAKLLMSLRARF